MARVSVPCGPEQSERENSHYLRFRAMLQQHGRRDVFDRLDEEFLESTRTFHERVGELLPHVIEPLRSYRIGQALMLLVHAAADRERAKAGGRPVLPFAVYVNDLLDGIVGFLEAPASPKARSALERVEPAGVSWPSCLCPTGGTSDIVSRRGSSCHDSGCVGSPRDR